MIYKLLWNVFGKGLTRQYRESLNKPTTHNDLEYAFTDHKGRKYFRFPDKVTMPLSRYYKMQEYLMWMSAKLTNEQLEMLCNKALNIVSDGVKKGNNAAGVAAILYQIKDRKDKIIPHELVLNIIAIQLVRADENPEQFDNEIHRDKVNAFIEDYTGNNGFFLQLKELRKLFNFTNISKTDWTDYIRESQAEMEIVKQSLKLY